MEITIHFAGRLKIVIAISACSSITFFQSSSSWSATIIGTDVTSDPDSGFGDVKLFEDF